MSAAVVRADGTMRLGGMMLRCAIGRSGVRPDRIGRPKEEGDGATPTGMLPLRRVLYRADRVAVPRAAAPREPIAPQDGWCDDPAHGDYNRPVILPHPGRHEALWRDDGLYDVIGVLGWNDAPVMRGHGSAIFLHVARHDLAPTEGCVALALEDLLRLLAAGVTALDVQPAD